MTNYIFCDQCIKDITKTKKLKAYQTHIFCSKECRDKWYTEDYAINDMLKLARCAQCNQEFTREQLQWFNLNGHGLCGTKCMMKLQAWALKNNMGTLVKRHSLKYPAGF